MRMKTRELAVCGLMIALSVVLGGVLSYNVTVGSIPGVKVGVGPLPVMLLGFLYGPLHALLSGVAADFLKATIFPVGAYNPAFTATYALLAATPSAIWRLMQGARGKPLVRPDYLPLLACVLASFLLWSTAGNTLLMVLFYGSSFAALLPPRLAALAVVLVYPYVMKPMLAAYDGFVARRG